MSGARLTGGVSDIDDAVRYFDRFVYDADYLNAPMIGIDTIIRSGIPRNVKDAFPTASL